MKELDVYLNKEDLATVKWLRKRIATGSRFFIARKTGHNAEGKGASRSVILGSKDNGKTWGQSCKIWGHMNEERAQEIIKRAFANQ